MNIFQRIGHKLRDMVFGGMGDWMRWPMGMNKRYERTDPLSANVVMAPVQWGMRQIIEAPMVVVRDGEILEEHPAIEQWENPNDFYTGTALEMAALLSLWIDGNVYILKVRQSSTRISGLWYIPHWLIEPWSDNQNMLIEYYRYRYAPEWKIAPEDVIHVRYGIDPENMRKGMSPLKTAVREIFTDEEASNFSASILSNMGFPGVIITPEGERPIPPQDVSRMREYFEDQYGGDRRGKPFVLGSPTKVEMLQWEPSKMNLGSLRNMSEERVCSLLGVPAAVVGFGTGLQQTTVGATLEELRKLAYENAIIPSQRLIREELNRSFLPEYEVRPGVEIEYDLSDVRVLQEDEGKKVERINSAVNGGWLSVSEAQRIAGFDVDETQNVYLRKMAVAEVPAQKRIAVVPRQLKNHRGYKNRELDVRYYNHIMELQEKWASRFAGELEDRFIMFGERVAEVFLELADQRGIAGRSGVSVKQMEYEVIGELAADRAKEDVPKREVLKYGDHYVYVGAQTVEELNQFFGLGIEWGDNLEAHMVNVARDREHLIDLDSQTKRSVTKAIREGVEAGEGTDQIAKRIKDKVGAGPWKTAETRAQVIARTETKWAQNMSTLEAGRGAGATAYRVVDAQVPADRPHPDMCGYICSEVDGMVVPEGDVQHLSSCEHVNGTRSFVPVFGEDAEQAQSPVPSA